MVDGGHQPLAEGIVEHRIDLLRGHAQARRRIAVDDHRSLQALVVGIGIDILQSLQVGQRRAYLGLPRAQHFQVV
ncbi:hypothetical protein D9M72_533280 [compost metagenome]